MIQGRKGKCQNTQFVRRKKKIKKPNQNQTTSQTCCEIVLISQQGIKETLLYIKKAQLLVYENWCVGK